LGFGGGALASLSESLESNEILAVLDLERASRMDGCFTSRRSEQENPCCRLGKDALHYNVILTTEHFLKYPINMYLPEICGQIILQFNFYWNLRVQFDEEYIKTAPF